MLQRLLTSLRAPLGISTQEHIDGGGPLNLIRFGVDLRFERLLGRPLRFTLPLLDYAISVLRRLSDFLLCEDLSAPRVYTWREVLILLIFSLNDLGELLQSLLLKVDLVYQKLFGCTLRRLQILCLDCN